MNDDEGVPRHHRRARPMFARGFMADPRKAYRLPMRADIRPGGDADSPNHSVRWINSHSHTDAGYLKPT